MSAKDCDAIDRFVEVNKGIAKRNRFISGCHTFVGDSGAVIYSYGYHFPLVVFTNENKFIINADTYSNTTASHTTHAIRMLGDSAPCIPFSALEEALQPLDNLNFLEAVKNIELLEIGLPFYVKCTRRVSKICPDWKDKNIHAGFIDNIRKEKTVIKETDKTIFVESERHHLGYTVFKFGDRHYISGMDEEHYFLCELVEPCNTVKEALRSMAGQLNDKEYKQYKRGLIKRQGELFFIPVGNKHTEFTSKKHIENLKKLERDKKIERDKPIPLSRGIASHIASKYFFDDMLGEFVKGRIKHTKGDHKTLMLKEWHIVIANTVKNSWSASGRVD